MKIRNGFVSNSSSSSFIIASESKKDLKVLVEIDLGSLIEQTIKTPKALKDYFIENYCLDYDMKEGSTFEEALANEDITDEYNDSLNEINNNNTVFVGSAANDEEGISALIYSNGLRDLIKDNKLKIIKDDS